MKILLVDDDPSVLASLERRLRRLHWTILTAADGAAGLALCDEGIDAVVSDQHMPGMTGLELLEKIAVAQPQVIRIMLTGEATMQLAIDAINRGHVDRFLVKPCAAEEVICAIKREAKFHAAISAVHDLYHRQQQQDRQLRSLQDDYPDIERVTKDADGAIVLEELPDDIDDFLKRYDPSA